MSDDQRYTVHVLFRKVTRRHYRGEQSAYNVAAANESDAKKQVRHQLAGTGAEITRVEK